MVSKDKLIPRTSASSPRSSSYLKKFMSEKSSSVEGEYHEMPASPRRPRTPSSRPEPHAESRSDNPSNRPQRPQMTPRRVLNKAPRSSVPSPRPKRPAIVTTDDQSEASGAAVKTPRAARSPRTPRRHAASPRNRVEKKKSEKPSKSKKTAEKAKPLLSGERVERSLSKPTPKSRSAAYKPPPVDVIGIKKQPTKSAPPMSPTPMAIAHAKKKARADSGRRQTVQKSGSIDSDRMNNDKYSMEDPILQNRALNKHESGNNQSEYTDGLYTEASRDTYDETVGDTTMGDETMGEDTMADELLGDETFSDENTTTKRSYRTLRHHFSSLSENTSFGDASILIKQQVAWGCIGLSALQFAVLTTQILLCGVASFAVNPLLGPYPDAFSEWGGKNSYLLVENQEYFRFITPVFLHVGYIHLLVNAFFQLETCAYLEREWGFLTWISIYLISGVGSCLAAAALDSNVIGVCSSGALMGLFGARISQAILWTAFECKTDYQGHGALIFERLGGVVCSAAVVFVLTFLTYIDWSGHLGGLCTGILAGFIFFSHALFERKTRATVRCFAFTIMLFGGMALGVVLFRFAYYDEELADACDYFRNLYREGYNCECQVFS